MGFFSMMRLLRSWGASQTTWRLAWQMEYSGEIRRRAGMDLGPRTIPTMISSTMDEMPTAFETFVASHVAKRKPAIARMAKKLLLPAMVEQGAGVAVANRLLAARLPPGRV